jgi:hypothetical protein
MPAAAMAAAGVILSREDIARRPAHFCAQRYQRFDQNTGLDRHMDAAKNFCTG